MFKTLSVSSILTIAANASHYYYYGQDQMSNLSPDPEPEPEPVVEPRRFAVCDVTENPTNLSPTGIKGLVKLE